MGLSWASHSTLTYTSELILCPTICVHSATRHNILDMYHHRVNPSIEFAGTHSYTWVERGTVRVKSLAQEHNTMSPARARTRMGRSGDARHNDKTITPLKLKQYKVYRFFHSVFQLTFHHALVSRAWQQAKQTDRSFR